VPGNRPAPVGRDLRTGEIDMRFRSESPLTQFSIAPQAPVAVTEAHANFEAIGAEFEAAKDALAEAKVSARVAIGDSHKSAAEARVLGTAPPKLSPDKVQAKAESDI